MHPTDRGRRSRQPAPIAFGLMPALPAVDLDVAADAVGQARGVVCDIAHHLAAAGGADDHQVVAYDLAHAAAAVENALAVLNYGARGEVEGRIACAFVADAVYD